MLPLYGIEIKCRHTGAIHTLRLTPLTSYDGKSELSFTSLRSNTLRGHLKVTTSLLHGEQSYIVVGVLGLARFDTQTTKRKGEILRWNDCGEGQGVLKEWIAGA